MSDYYLELEKPIYEIEKRIKLIQKDLNVDSSPEINKLRKDKEKMTKDIFSKLTRWERVQLARHPQRPFFMDYINHFVEEKIELHGDRHFADDPAVICIIGKIQMLRAQPPTVLCPVERAHQRERDQQAIEPMLLGHRALARPYPLAHCFCAFKIFHACARS